MKINREAFSVTRNPSIRPGEKNALTSPGKMRRKGLENSVAKCDDWLMEWWLWKVLIISSWDVFITTFYHELSLHAPISPIWRPFNHDDSVFLPRFFQSLSFFSSSELCSPTQKIRGFSDLPRINIYLNTFNKHCSGLMANIYQPLNIFQTKRKISIIPHLKLSIKFVVKCWTKNEEFQDRETLVKSTLIAINLKGNLLCLSSIFHQRRDAFQHFPH